MRNLKKCICNDINIVFCVDSYLCGYLGSRFHENLVIKKCNLFWNKLRNKFIAIWNEFRNQNTVSRSQLKYQQFIESTCLGRHKNNMKKRENIICRSPREWK